MRCSAHRRIRGRTRPLLAHRSASMGDARRRGQGVDRSGCTRFGTHGNRPRACPVDFGAMAPGIPGQIRSRRSTMSASHRNSLSRNLFPRDGVSESAQGALDAHDSLNRFDIVRRTDQPCRDRPESGDSSLHSGSCSPRGMQCSGQGGPAGRGDACVAPVHLDIVRRTNQPCRDRPESGDSSLHSGSCSPRGMQCSGQGGPAGRGDACVAPVHPFVKWDDRSRLGRPTRIPRIVLTDHPRLQSGHGQRSCRASQATQRHPNGQRL